MVETQQALIEVPINIPPGSKPWSQGLGRLLTEGDDGRSAIRLIAVNRTLRAEAERMLPVIIRCAQPAEPEEIMAILVREAPHYGVVAKGAREWAALFSSYIAALDGLPAAAIEDAFVRWNRGEGMRDVGMAGWYPKAPQIYMLAEEHKRELIMASYRAKKALEWVEKKAPVQTDEERAANSAAIRAMMAKPAQRLPPQPPGVTLAEWARHCRENNLMQDGAPESIYPSPRLSPQEVAANLRASAAPKDHDPGDVI